MKNAVIEVLSGPLAGMAYPLVYQKMTVGRSSDCLISPEGYSEVSRQHACFVWNGKGFTVQDLGSKNGVSVGGQSMSEAMLGDQDVASLGDFSFRLHIPEGGPEFAGVEPTPAVVQYEPQRSVPRPGCRGTMGWVATGLVAAAVVGAIIAANANGGRSQSTTPASSQASRTEPISTRPASSESVSNALGQASDANRPGELQPTDIPKSLHSAMPIHGPANENPTTVETALTAKGSVEMVYVPAGEFTMGSEAGGPDQMPVRKVYLDAYRIGKTEVTVAQFRAYCQSTGYSYDWKASQPSWGWQDDHPMVNVTWDEARAFCRWAGGDLPTEAQWEKAARGPDGRDYPWGTEWDGSKCANSVGPNRMSGPKPVGSYPSDVSPYGCLDMAGNVAEWCRDWMGKYDPGATRNPTGPSSGDNRVLRGGTWANGFKGLFRNSHRFGITPEFSSRCFGFRIASGL